MSETESTVAKVATIASAATETPAAFLERSREEFATDKQRDLADRTEGQDDHKFTFSSDSTVRSESGVGSQWSDRAFKQRKAKKLPIMQWNRMHIYQQHVENQGRQNDFAIKVSQADGGEKATAEYYQDRIRQIEYESNFSSVTAIARSNQLSAGRGWFRVSTKYRKGTFEQYACLDEVPDAFSIIPGPHKEMDCSDAERMWEVFYITKAQYKRSYGQKKLDEATAFAEDGPNMEQWVDVGTTGQMMQIARKYQKEIKKRTLYLSSDGVTGIPAEDIAVEEALMMGLLSVDEQGQPITREEDVCEVWVYLIDGAHILKKEQFIVDEIPVVPQWGLCTILDGVQRHFSMGNRAKEPQRLLNLAISNLAALVGAQSKAQFMMDLESIEKQHQNDWAGLTNAVLLLYNRYSKDGTRDLGVPQQVVNPPQIEACIAMYREAVEGIKAAYGVYDAQLGRTKADQSGKAIESLKEQGEQVNYHFLANEAIAHKRLGQILVKIIQKTDTPGSTRMVRTEAGKSHAVPIGQPFKHYRTGKEAIIQPKSDVELGITVDMGPSYQSARKQVNETDLALINSLPPEAAMVLLPEFLRTQDAPNSEGRAEIAERLVNMKMPGVLPPKEEDGPQVPPEAQQQIVELQQKLQAAEAFAQEQFEKLKSEQLKLEADAVKQDKELAFKKWEAELKAHIEMAKIGSAEDRVLLEKELGHTQTLESAEMEATEAERERQHRSGEAQAAREHQSAEAEATREATAEQADLGRQHELTAAEMAANEGADDKD